MPRGSRLYASLVPVSAMVQVSDSVGTAQNGSINAVCASGIASMSEASMLFQPRMLEPSKPRPLTNTSSVSSLLGTLKCCQVPKVSTNFTSTILAPCFLAISITLLGVAAVFAVLIGCIDIVALFAGNALALPTADHVRDYWQSRARRLRAGYAPW